MMPWGAGVRVALLAILALVSSSSPREAAPGGAPAQGRIAATGATGHSLSDTTTIALVGARIYPSPSDPPLEGGVVVLRGTRILAVGRSRDEVPLLPNTRFVDCSGLTVTAGFWNNHVHFTDPRWLNAGRMRAPRLSRELYDAFLRYGFTTVFDTGSPLGNTLMIRRRVGAGEVQGPRIFTTGPGLVPVGGTPFYVRPERLPEVAGAAQAAALVDETLQAGADAIKVFTAPFPEDGKPAALMPVPLVRAITSAAHAQGRLVFAHPENDAGVSAAVEGGVDVLAHTAPSGSAWSGAQVERMRRLGVALVPTLSLFSRLATERGLSAERRGSFLEVPLAQLRAFSKAGGQVLFGTDAGFVADHDPAEEYRLMREAGMSWDQILASLTTAPAERFGLSRSAGRIRVGMDADLVVLEGDPATDLEALTRVRYVVRAGRLTPVR